MDTDDTACSIIQTLCFESDDKDSLILNYSSLPALVRFHSADKIICAIEHTVKRHMQNRHRTSFVFHLFCTGMYLKNIHLHRNFIFKITSMFREKFPRELAACYVHDAPAIFNHLYDLIKPFLNRQMQKRIIIVKNSETMHANASFEQAMSKPRAHPKPTPYLFEPFRCSGAEIAPLHHSAGGRAPGPGASSDGESAPQSSSSSVASS